MHTLSGCTPASSLRSSRARQALAMNRTQHTVMLSSIISERTVKKRAPFSHTLSLFHSLVLFIRVHPTLGQDDRTKLLMAFPFTFASPPPLLLSLFYSSLIFLAFHLLMQLCWQASSPLFLPTSVFPDIYWLPLLFYSVISHLTKSSYQDTIILFSSSRPKLSLFVFLSDRQISLWHFIFALHLIKS